MNHTRRSTRLPSFNYSQNGAYFITLVAHHRATLFGEIAGGEMQLNPLGRMIEKELLRLTGRFPGLEIGQFVVMPNHVHAVLIIYGESPASSQPDGNAPQSSPHPRVAPGSLGAIVRALKSSTTLLYHRMRDGGTGPLWQRNYYDRIIRNDRELESISLYILNNPLNWELDHENPSHH